MAIQKARDSEFQSCEPCVSKPTPKTARGCRPVDPAKASSKKSGQDISETRKKKLLIRLSDTENDYVISKANLAGLTKTEYSRSLILDHKVDTSKLSSVDSASIATLLSGMNHLGDLCARRLEIAEVGDMPLAASERIVQAKLIAAAEACMRALGFNDF